MHATSVTHRRGEHLATDHPMIVQFGRVGWLAKGVVYLFAGGLALLVASRSSGWSAVKTGAQEASPTGAIKTVAQSTGGSLLLVVLGIALFFYAAWRVLTAVLPGSTDAKGWATRVGYAISAIIYTTFAVTAISLANTPQAKANGNKTVSDLTRRVMQHTAGRSLIGIAGVLVIGVGLYRISQGLQSDVTEDIDMSAMSAERSRWTRRVGAIGEIGRGIAMSLIGFFLVRAAITFKAAEATGMDGTLRRLALHPWGVVFVAIVGFGLMAYGLFCITTFTRRQLQAP